VAVSACSAGKCNNFKCTPIRVEIYREDRKDKTRK
jgi:uncharacterized protein YcgI (DUF1989 family)